jgi:hypothetical protein
VRSRRIVMALLGTAATFAVTLLAPTASATPLTGRVGVPPVPATATQATTTTASLCDCVPYVQNYIGHINTYYAKDAGPALKAMGYRESTSPMGINDIVVLQPGFAGAYPPGHIAFLASYSSKGGTVSVILRGANQPGGKWTDHGCSNVSRWPFSYSNGSGIRYYRH